MNRRFLIISGYGWSGSSLLVDYFKEYSGFVVPDVEFRLIKDPHGISEMENSLIHHWDFINSDAAITEFITLCHYCNQKCHHFYNKFGLNYSELLNKRFLDITKNYVESISSFQYKGNNYYHEFRKHWIKSVIRRFSVALNRRTKGLINIPFPDDSLFFCKPSSEDFLAKTRSYIEELFLPIFNDNKIVVLDQAISPLHYEDLKYFNDVKMIIVDRNPQDIYIDMIQNNSLIGSELKRKNDVDKYIEWHNAIRRSDINDDRVLLLQFEDIVEDTSNIEKEIKSFLNWDYGEKLYPKRFFNPVLSAENINLVNKYPQYRKEVDIISSFFGVKQ